MSVDESTAAAEGFDLDEDLFNFDEITGGEMGAHEDDADLDEIFATFQVDAEEEEEEPAAPLPDTQDEVTDSGPALTAPDPTPEPTPEPTTPDPAAEAPAAPAPAPAQPAAAPVAAAPVAAAPAAVAAAPGAVPVQYVAAAPAAQGTPRPMLWLFVALTSINAVLAIVVLNIASSMSSGVEKMTDEVKGKMFEFTDAAYGDLTALQAESMPVSPVDPANHEAFQTANHMIENGRFADARRLLYALLAVVDRMDPELRADVESRANYLIAHTYQREAHARIGGPR